MKVIVIRKSERRFSHCHQKESSHTVIRKSERRFSDCHQKMRKNKFHTLSSLRLDTSSISCAFAYVTATSLSISGTTHQG
eukprot:116432-Amorphochlora_amoeboformis.AAC.1